MKELDLSTVDDLAAFVNAQRSAASNWLNGYNFPTVPSMALLCEKRPGLTLDWIYLGVADALPMALAIKMQALQEGIPLPARTEKSAAAVRAKTAKGRPSQARRKKAIEA